MKKENWALYLFYIVLAGTLAAGLITGESFAVFQSVLIAGTITALFLLFRKTRLKMPPGFFNMVLGFVFLAMYLGKITNFYALVPGWDKWLHLASGLMLTPIGFFVFRKIGGERLVANHIFLTVCFAFLFSVAGAAVWEIFEFSCDQLVGTNTQNNSLYDTMMDIICGSGSGLVAAFLLSWHLKRQNN